MDWRIRIKQSSTKEAPVDLMPGELAFSFVSRTLFIGDKDGTPLVLAEAKQEIKVMEKMYKSSIWFLWWQLPMYETFVVSKQHAMEKGYLAKASVACWLRPFVHVRWHEVLEV